MTLDTRFAITSPVLKPREVFDHCNVLLAAATGWPVERITYESKPDGWHNRLGQGLVALLSVTYGPNGPMTAECYADWDPDTDDEGRDAVCRDGDPCSGCEQPAAFVMVSFDTAYGYQSPTGLGCSDLHAALVDALGEWCDQRGLSWSWYHEFRDEWHEGRDGLARFGNAAAARREWASAETVSASAPE